MNIAEKKIEYLTQKTVHKKAGSAIPHKFFFLCKMEGIVKEMHPAPSTQCGNLKFYQKICAKPNY